MTARRIAIAAGGTGGHLFPAEALARALEARGHSVTLLTDARTAERAGDRFGEIRVVDGAGLVGRSTRARVAALGRLARGTVAARAALSASTPAVLVGFGGYPSVPPVIAARTLGARRRPAVLLHDQNAVLGRANRTLARLADVVATSFDRVEGLPAGVRSVTTGNPVRASIAAIGPYRPPGATLELLVLGGSLGARVFSDVVPGAVAALGRPVRVVQQARAEDVERVRAAYAASGIEAEISPFFTDVAARLEAAHLVIARAGGSTVAELAACGRPSLLVPLPIAAGDEQAANASRLVEAGAAWTVRQAQFDAAWLARHLSLPDAALAAAAAAARSLARNEATEMLAHVVEDLANFGYDTTTAIRPADLHAARDGGTSLFGHRDESLVTAGALATAGAPGAEGDHA